MDVRELERWSRADLDREGRRIGIYRPEALSRAELERRVREHHRTPAARAIGRARGMFGRVLGLARTLATVASLPPPTTTPVPPRPSSPPRASSATSTATRTDAEVTAPVPTAEVSSSDSISVSDSVSVSDSDSVSVSDSVSDSDSVPVSDSVSVSNSDSVPISVSVSDSVPVSVSDSVSDSIRLSDSVSVSDSVSDSITDTDTVSNTVSDSTELDELDDLELLLRSEPIPTRRMAQILAHQGHERRALAIYRKLVRDAPHDAPLRAEAEAVGHPAASREGEEEEESDRDECVAVPLRAGEALVAWHVSSGALRRARSLVGEDASLVLRAIVLDLGDGGAPRRRVREEDVAVAGERMLQLEGRSRVVAAVGVRAGDRFVSIAHAPALEVGEPQPR